MSNINSAQGIGINTATMIIGLATALVTLGLANQARADAMRKPDISFNAAITSDYVFRGVSQTTEDPAVQLGMDVSQGAFYAGAWTSNVDFGDGETEAEIDLYAGIRPQYAGLKWDVGVIGYVYTSQPDTADYNYGEFKIAATRAVGQGALGAAVFYSPDFFGETEGEATYAEVNGGILVHPRVTVSGAAGHQWLSSDLGYSTWNLGASWKATEHLALDVRYHDTDVHALDRTYGSRVVFSLKAVI